MKPIKLFFLLTALAITSTLQSCLDEDKVTVTYQPAVGTVNNENGKLLFDTDYYGVLEPINATIFSNYDADENGQRVMASIVFMDNAESQKTDTDNYRQIQVLELYKILTKNADSLTEEQEDVYGNDPILISGGYISKKHLNLEFNIWRNDPSIAHRISLLLTEKSAPDENGMIHLELRHNAESDEQYTLAWGLVSFNLSSIPGYSDERFKGFIIEYSGQDGQTSTFTIKINDNKAKSSQIRMSAPVSECTYIE